MCPILIFTLCVSMISAAPSLSIPTMSATGVNTSESSITTDQATSPPTETNMPRIIMSMVEKGPSKSNDEVLGLPNDLVFDALIGNINTLQDQIELCEEELIEKAGNHHKHHSDTTSVTEDEATVNGEEGRDNSETSRLRLKRTLTADKNIVKQSNSVDYDTFAREIVNRLSARLEYLKHSLAQCYGLFKVWNNQLVRQL